MTIYNLTHAKAKDLFENTRKRKLCHNTYLVKTGANSYGVKLHDTVVVEYLDEHRFTLNSGGWDTPTTKKRWAHYAPMQIHTLRVAGKCTSSDLDGATIDMRDNFIQYPS